MFGGSGCVLYFLRHLTSERVRISAPLPDKRNRPKKSQVNLQGLGSSIFLVLCLHSVSSPRPFSRLSFFRMHQHWKIHSRPIPGPAFYSIVRSGSCFQRVPESVQSWRGL